MTEWDVYYLAKDNTFGRFAGTILHVCPAGSLIGRRMILPRVLRCQVTCGVFDVAKFWSPSYTETGMVLHTRWLIDVCRVAHGDRFSLEELPLVDRLPAARGIVALGFRIPV